MFNAFHAIFKHIVLFTQTHPFFISNLLFILDKLGTYKHQIHVQYKMQYTSEITLHIYIKTQCLSYEIS